MECSSGVKWKEGKKKSDVIKLKLLYCWDVYPTIVIQLSIMKNWYKTKYVGKYVKRENDTDFKSKMD